MAVQPQGDGVTLLYASIVLLCFCYVTYGTRVATRLWRHSLGMDDHLMGLGLVRSCLVLSLVRRKLDTDWPADAFHRHSQSLHCLRLLWIWSKGSNSTSIC